VTGAQIGVATTSSRAQILTIPSADTAFRAHVQRIQSDGVETPDELERRLRLVFPRVVVRARSLTGEGPAWYVYRDGGWRSSASGEWWTDASLPRVVVSPDGWLVEANATAAGLMGFEPDNAATHHFTDFVVPGTLTDATALFEVIGSGRPLTATILVRPTTGDAIAVDLHTEPEGDHIVGVFRLADDIEVTAERGWSVPPNSLATKPAVDVAFRAYALRALARMPEPTPDGLALRLRRLYPHATVEATTDGWIARREAGADDGVRAAWWDDRELPRVRYDRQALITETNPAAEAFFGRQLVGHHWQEFVTAGSTEQVSVMLEILAEIGAAESRFRMPRSDGSLVEFESYTTVDGEDFTTVLRPLDAR
jgi:PAS domain-containing protein